MLLRFLLLTVLNLALAACSEPETALRIEGRTMGTFYAVTLADPFPGGEKALHQQVEARLAQISQEISTYDPNSVLSRFNRSPANTPFPIPALMARAVAQGITAGQTTHGLLDVTVGPLVNLWGFGPDKRPQHTPSDAEIAAARARVGIDKLHLTQGKEGALLSKSRADLYLDLSTLGEGVGADAIAELLEQSGVHHYLVEIAGAVRSKGHNPNGAPWRIAIVDPSDKPGAFQAVVAPKEMAVSTAGSYRNYYELDGKRYSHIINPRTGKPITHRLVSATVILPTALEADAYDTALMVMGPEQALTFAQKNRLAVYLIVKTDRGFEARYTPQFTPYLVQ
ncbi:FAD:protein FMN transferase [Aeromonas simiae]|uniref:FAD:protein FMN transferase n=1 Tax=Aeromonas simiae TaxID=218936 RepID=UPI00266C9AA8|nr:FAD:protein FMN transferase [Aeromonas simiae]MDO2948091.1 FAD:protein FMN transferase [Aeromonas simiae]MDO2952830.1 FAD:protein FMN transferase [Aeromonas simiae]MDO2955490.1 FAD:protein FMN transferase [Aeromonas simiae]